MGVKKNRWITETETSLLKSPVVNIVQKDCKHSEDPSKQHRFYVLDSRNWCNVIPVTPEGEVVLIEQYRIGIDEWTLELPGGVADDTDLNLEAAALRELKEETGYGPCSPYQCQSLGWSHPNPAILNNQVYSFVIGPVEFKTKPKLDEGELIFTKLVPIDEIEDMLRSGEISHALIRNSFLHLMLQYPGKSLREALERYMA